MDSDEREGVREIAAFLARVDFTRGPVVAVAQDWATRDVRMVGWMTRDALELTLRTGVAHYHSRSRGRTYKKGQTSGNLQQVHRLMLSCDGESLVLEVEQVGDVSCHRGTRTCFTHGVSLEVMSDEGVAAPLPVVPVTVGAPSRGQAGLLQQPLDTLALETHVRPLLAAYQSLLRIDPGESPFGLPRGADRAVTAPRLVDSVRKLGEGLRREEGAESLVPLAAHVWSWGAVCVLLDETANAPGLAAAIAQGYFGNGSASADVTGELERVAEALSGEVPRERFAELVTSALQAAGRLMKVLDVRPYAFLEHDRQEMLVRPHVGDALSSLGSQGTPSGLAAGDSFIHRPLP